FGGPQAGLLSGREGLIQRVRANPLFRALRVDKLTYAALEATLMEYVRQNHDAIPFLRMLRMPVEEVRERALAAQEKLSSATNLKIEIIAGESLVGGGSAPTSTLPTFLRRLRSVLVGPEYLTPRFVLVPPRVLRGV